MPSPIVNAGLLYVNNLQVAWASNTTLTIAAGQCRDSSNTWDIVSSSSLTLNAANTGANGIDTGTFAASKMYYVYMIWDSSNSYVCASLLSLSASAPTLPTGYSAYRLIGAWPTDGSAHFLAGYYSGNGSTREFWYDAIAVTPITAGNSGTFAACDLSNIVPAIDNLPVNFYMNFTANAAADTAAFRPTGSSSTAGQHIITAQVAGATAHRDQKVKLLAKLASGAPKIDYKVSAGTLAIDVEGFQLDL